MSDIISKYYENSKLPKELINQKLEKFDNNPDIASEFEHWIETGDYIENEAISVEGYTAKSLSNLSRYLNGEGAFLILIELREDSKTGLKRITEGFKFK